MSLEASAKQAALKYAAQYGDDWDRECGFQDGYTLGFTKALMAFSEAIKYQYCLTNWPDEDTFCNKLVPKILATLNGG